MHDATLPGKRGGESQNRRLGRGRSYEVRGAEAHNSRTQVRGGNSVRERGGDEAFSRNSNHRGGRLATVRAVCTLIHSIPMGQWGTTEAEFTGRQGIQEFGYSKDNKKPTVRRSSYYCTTVLRKSKETTRMGVISSRNREAYLIPKYLRIKAKTKCYCGYVDPKQG